MTSSNPFVAVGWINPAHSLALTEFLYGGTNPVGLKRAKGSGLLLNKLQGKRVSETDSERGQNSFCGGEEGETKSL